MGKIVVKNLRSYAYHGCLEAEKKIGTYYETTIWVDGDFSKSEKTDDLNDAVDYEKLGIIVQEQMKISSNLIEHVVARIIKEIEIQFSDYLLGLIKVKVAKINPPVKGDVPQVEYIKEKRF